MLLLLKNKRSSACKRRFKKVKGRWHNKKQLDPVKRRFKTHKIKKMRTMNRLWTCLTSKMSILNIAQCIHLLYPRLFSTLIHPIMTLITETTLQINFLIIRILLLSVAMTTTMVNSSKKKKQRKCKTESTNRIKKDKTYPNKRLKGRMWLCLN